jgi:outer membrane protein TolC
MAVAGCQHPPQVTESERQATAKEDLDAIVASQPAPTGPINLYEAMARSLKYNLDRQIRITEAFFAAGEFDVSRFNLLPTLDGSIEYRGRSNEAGSSSRSLITGRESLEPSTSLSRNRFLADVRLVWSLLDFGVSYIRLKQQGNKVLMAQEVRRKVTNRVMNDTQRAYWRALAAERLARPLRGAIAAAEGAIARTRRAQQNGDISPRDALEYERRLLRTMRELQRREGQLALARSEIAALMNIDPTTRFALAGAPDGRRAGQLPDLPRTPSDLATMRIVALTNRPELYEFDYKNRIAALEKYVEILATLPGVRLDGSFNFDSNEFLFNNTWAEFGARLTVQIVKLASLKSRLDLAEVRQELAVQERRSMTLAVLAQLHIAHETYLEKLKEIRLAQRQLAVEGENLRTTAASREVSIAGETAYVEALASYYLAELDYYFTYAEAQSARSEVLTSMGIDMVPESMAAEDIGAIARAFEEFHRRGLDARVRKAADDSKETWRSLTAALPPVPARRAGRAPTARDAAGQAVSSTD